MKFEFHVSNMGRKNVLANRFNFPNNSLVFLQHIQELIVVHFELLFLEQNDPRILRDRDTLSV